MKIRIGSSLELDSQRARNRMCRKAVKIEVNSARRHFPPVVPTVRKVMLKSPIKDQRSIFTLTFRPMRSFERLSPGLARIGHAIQIDQRVYEGSCARHCDGQAECALAIPNCKCRIQ